MRRMWTVWATALVVVFAAIAANACDFYFSYSEISAPIGTYGEIGVRVQKTHNNCTLTSMDDYQFAWENVQILGSTEWEEIGPNLYERWFEVSLSETGEGYLQISKDCTKEGYQEAALPITVLDPDEGGLWYQASGGTYPLEGVANPPIESVTGSFAYEAGVLSVGDVTVELPETAIELADYLPEARLFFTTTDVGEVLPLLVVSEGAFVRFDHLIEDLS